MSKKKSGGPVMMKYVPGVAESVLPAAVQVRDEGTGELETIYFSNEQDREFSEKAYMMEEKMLFGYVERAGKKYLMAIVRLEEEPIEGPTDMRRPQ